jgi:hypothetical protein
MLCMFVLLRAVEVKTGGPYAATSRGLSLLSPGAGELLAIAISLVLWDKDNIISFHNLCLYIPALDMYIAIA